MKPPGSVYWSALEPYWDSISIYDGGEEFQSELRAVPALVQTLFAAHWCSSEVCNGGLKQLFTNSTGVLAPEAVMAFRALGMPALADVLSEAMKVFGSSYSREREVREEQLEKLRLASADPYAWRPFDKLDRRFFALLDTENGGFPSTADAYVLRLHPPEG